MWKDRHCHQRDVVLVPFVPVGPLSRRRPAPARGSSHATASRPSACPWCPRYKAGSRCPWVRAAPSGSSLLCASRHVAKSCQSGAPPSVAMKLRTLGSCGWNAADLFDEFGPDEQHRRLAVFDNEGDLGSGQPPVDRRHHHIGLHRAEQQFEIDVAVLAEIGDPLIRLDAKRPETVGDLVGMGVQFGIAGPPSLEFERHGVTARFTLRAYDVGQISGADRRRTCFFPG